MKRTTIHISAAIALLLGLAACTQDEAGFLPEGAEGTPIVFTATGLKPAATATVGTRAPVDGNWEGVQSVAVLMGGTVKAYDVMPSTTDPTSTTLTSTAPHRWTNHNDITVTAWWPYTEGETTLPAVKVKANQSAQKDFETSDLIVADGQTVTYGSPTLRFTHRTARVTIEMKPGTGFTSVAGATVSLMSLSADNGNPTAIKTYNASGNTYEALTTPQTVAAGKPFIRVELGGGIFYFRPQTNVVLEAGNRYTYTITVKANNGIEVTEAKSGAWTPGVEETVESIVFKTNLSTAKVGDFITTDGKLLEMTESMTLSEEMKKRIAGVVFWVPEKKDPHRQTQASLQSDEVMAKAHPNCTHGLAVSLKDVSAEMHWQDQYEAVLNFQRGDAFNPAYDKSLFKPIASNNGSSHPINFILGYQNTLILRAYNEYCKRTSGKENHVVLPVDALAGFETNNPSPSNSTGWFLPSPKELHILCYKDVDDIGSGQGSSYTETLDIVNKSLTAAGGETFAYKSYYWSSSEFAGFLAHAFLVNFRNADVLSVSKYYNTFRVRAVCAF